MNFVKILPSELSKRYWGRRWPSAVVTTSSEGGMPDRIVRSDDPKESQTSWRKGGGEILKQASSDDPALDEDTLRGQLTLDEMAIVERFSMHVLIAVSLPQRFHSLHPKVMSERTELIHGLP
jgi:hypothetical protein